MATVYGCINPDLTIIFENLETCLNQSACLVRSGVHAMQVALTLSGANNEDCNDTFYSTCFNPITGKFKVVIPDDCCGAPPIPCQYCSSTPSQVFVSFSGLDMFPGHFPNGYCNNMGSYSQMTTWNLSNGSFLLVQADACTWYFEDNGPTYFERIRLWHSPDCSGNPISDEISQGVYVRVDRGFYYQHPELALLNCVRGNFSANYLPTEDTCVDGIDIANQFSPYPGEATVTGNCDESIWEWDSLTSYSVGNVVKHSGFCYESILAPNINHEPPNLTYWNPL